MTKASERRILSFRHGPEARSMAGGAAGDSTPPRKQPITGEEAYFAR